LLDGMWITKFTPIRKGDIGSMASMDSGGGGGAGEFDPGAQGGSSVESAGSTEGLVVDESIPRHAVVAVEISGYAYKDKVQQPDILQFRDALRQSPLLDPVRTEILAVPMEGRDDFVREFSIRVVLRKPLEL